MIAHEIGHHVAGHMFIAGADAHAQEFEADAFAGHALALLGASQDQALSFSGEFSITGAASHPPRHKRVAAITAGWQRGQAVRAAR